MLKSFARRVLPPRFWESLRVWKLRRTVSRYRRRVVRHRYGARELSIELTDPLAEGWYDGDWPWLPEIEVLRRHRLKPGARVFDLGAHQGIVAFMLADAVGESGRVVAVEASPHNFLAAMRNLELNPTPQLHFAHAAVAASPGKLLFSLGLTGQVDVGQGGWGRTEVRATTVDELSQEYGYPDVLFVDVEGFECAVLTGAGETMLRRPDAFVEVHVGHGLETYRGSVEAILEFFPTDQYELLIGSESAPEFVPLSVNSPLPRDRFFLVALARSA
jgi:FkbM family methyltransferase